jgi:hypothetical protein
MRKIAYGRDTGMGWQYAMDSTYRVDATRSDVKKRKALRLRDHQQKEPGKSSRSSLYHLPETGTMRDWKGTMGANDPSHRFQHIKLLSFF